MKLPSPHWSRCQITTHRSVSGGRCCSCFAGMLSQCFKFGGRAVAIFGYVWVWDHFRLIELPWDSTWTWLLCFLTQDLAYYFGHRAIHEVGFFWGLHTIHHSSEYFNLSTSFRQAAIQDAGLAAHDILQALFIPPPIFLVHRYFSEIFQFWMHTSLLGSLGPLGFVFNTPSHHRVHHGRNAYCIDRNFGGVLIIWDRMFGTFEAERMDDPPVYGLIRSERSFNQLWLQFHSLKELLCDKWRLKDEKGENVFPGCTDKLRALLFPPAWLPGVKVRLFFHWASLDDHTHGVTPIELPVQKYDPPLSRWLKAYCLMHFLLLLTMFLQFEYDRGQFGYVEFSLQLIFFIYSMQSFGAFFDKKKFAPFLETLRLIGFIAYYTTRAVVKPDDVESPGICMVALFFVSAIGWAVILLRHLIRKRAKVAKMRMRFVGWNKSGRPSDMEAGDKKKWSGRHKCL
uniref:Alkylglycerol monooxygenase n=1 Tax=Globodera rostochiensis TaxID=31243 RepID=A0A914IFU1_GLORO